MCVDKDDYDKNPKKYNDIRNENQKTSIFPIKIRLIDKNVEKIPLTDLIPRVTNMGILPSETLFQKRFRRNRELVFDTIKKSRREYGMYVSQIAEKTGLSQFVLRKILSHLVKIEKIEFSKKGRIKCYKAMK